MHYLSVMKSYRKELYFNLPARRGFINITPQVEAAIKQSGIREGLVLVNAMNITASVFINDDESGLHWDMEQWLERLAPERPYEQYRHNGYEDNADAHLKRTVMGREVVCAVTDGKLDFGTWEHSTAVMVGMIAQYFRPARRRKKFKILPPKALRKFFGQRFIPPKLLIRPFAV